MPDPKDKTVTHVEKEKCGQLVAFFFACIANAMIDKCALDIAVISPVLTQSMSNDAFPLVKQNKLTWKRACPCSPYSFFLYEPFYKNIEVGIIQILRTTKNIPQAESRLSTFLFC